MSNFENVNISIEAMNIEPGATVLAYYDALEISADTAYEIHKLLTEEFPKNEVISLPNCFSLKLFDPDTLIVIRDQIDELLGDFADYE